MTSSSPPRRLRPYRLLGWLAGLLALATVSLTLAWPSWIEERFEALGKAVGDRGQPTTVAEWRLRYAPADDFKVREETQRWAAARTAHESARQAGDKTAVLVTLEQRRACLQRLLASGDLAHWKEALAEWHELHEQAGRLSQDESRRWFEALEIPDLDGLWTRALLHEQALGVEGEPLAFEVSLFAGPRRWLKALRWGAGCVADLELVAFLLERGLPREGTPRPPVLEGPLVMGVCGPAWRELDESLRQTLALRSAAGW